MASAKTSEVMEQFKRAVIPNYPRYDIVFERGEGVRLTDTEGKEYLDLFSGWAVTSVGHCHPKLVEAICEQAKKLCYMPNVYYWQTQGKLADCIRERAGGRQAFFCNSGAEAVEGAIKLARLRGGDERYRTVSFNNSFHGRTLATLTATGQDKYHKGIGPLPPGFDYANLNDLASVEALVTSETAAVIVEPVQCEGGMNVSEPGFLEGLRALCDDNGALLIFDEVWSGVGRSGRWFCHQHYGVEPDIMTLAKGLGGGLPIGAVVATPEVAQAMKPGTHASTFGGNAVAAAAGCAVFDIIESEGLLEHVETEGRYMIELLGEIAVRTGAVEEIRGLGFMVGVEHKRPGADVVKRALEMGVLTNCCHENVLRLAPALTITRAELDEGLEKLEKAIAG